MPPVGLCNLGASCYLNASLQSLFATPELDLALQQGGNDVANRLARVYTDWRTATEPIRPTLLTDIYYRNRQEDAHFFLLQLLDEVQQPDGIQHVAQSFMGVECRRLRCQHCGWQREAVRINFTCLQLELPSENAPFTTVEKLLRNHLSHITLLEQGLDSFQCPDIECTRARRHKDPPLHVPHVQSWPRVLFLQLKRWDNHNRLKLIDVECQETVEVDGTRYNLAAVVTHIGAGPNFGHYVAYCRRPGGWTRCNDRTVQEMSWREINNFHTLPGEKTYLLFYTKILPEDAIVIDSPETSPRPAAAAPIDLDPSDSDSDVLIQKDDPEPKTLSQELSDMVDAIQSDSNVGDRSQPAADRQKRAVSQDARPAKRLRGIYNYTKEERLLIGDTLRKSASLKDAMKALSDAMPKFTVKNVDSSSYLNRTTLRSWFNDHERLAKALALPDKISGETASSLSSTNNNDLAENSAPPDKIPPDSSSRRPPSKSCRSTLSEDDAAIVATALAEVNGAEDLAKILAVRLPGFSCEDRTAANYIPRSTLYNWIHRHQVKEWFGQDVVQVHTTWQEEHIRYFGVVAEKPQQRADMEPESSDVDVMWFTRGSWMFCPHCGRHQARTFTAEGSITDCKPGRPCKPCCDPDALDLQKPPEGQVPFGKLMGYVTASPLPLTTLLSEKEIQDLAIADIKVDYVTKRGGHAEVVSKQKKTV
ncbi:Usp17lc, partial [Symbiodinium sp. KB8]